MEISDLLEQTDKLPNVPEVVRELVQALNDPDADYNLIAEKVAKDQTLSLKILRLVNSAHFGLTRKVSTIDEAVVILGMDKLNTLVIASGMANSASDVDGLDMREFWSDSFMVASIAQWLALRSDTVQADVAFTAGVIYNIGRLLLHLAAPNRAKAIHTLVKETKASRVAAETERLGFTSQDAGKALLDMWKLPEELGIAIKQYKRPYTYEVPSPLSAILNLANYINGAITDKREIDEVIVFMPKKVIQLAGLKVEILDEVEGVLNMESGLDGLI